MQLGAIIDGKYRVERLLGQGGMGAVYEGFHTLIERKVAIKILAFEISASEDGMARFAREARAAGRIGNEHILDVYDVGSLSDGTRYMVSEYLDGETLSSRLARTGTMAPRDIGALALQLLTGLGAAHQAGIIHRDLKPDNVFLLKDKRGQTDFVKIIDFGISKFEVGDGASMSMTRTGTVLGTPYYLSPEQAKGMVIDARSDLYSVGVIFYEALSGRVPFSATNFNELLFKIALETPEPLERLIPGLDPAISAFVEKAMARNPGQRFQNTHEMQSALRSWLSMDRGMGTQPFPGIAFASLPAGTSAPTGSNFAGTARRVVAPRGRRPRTGLWILGAVVLLSLGTALALLLRSSPEQAAAAVASPASASNRLAHDLPIPPPAAAQTEAPRAEPFQPAPVFAVAPPQLDSPAIQAEGAPAKSLPHTPRLPSSKATGVAPTAAIALPAVEPTPALPVPAHTGTTPSSKPTRDFGY